MFQADGYVEMISIAQALRIVIFFRWVYANLVES